MEKSKQADANKNEAFPGYPAAAPGEDIFDKEQEIPLKPEDDLEFANELDVPGAELDDADEKIGEEDEENNSYSIGGDRHNDLDEN